MMLLMTIMAALAMISCALVGGVFFAFSSFVMKALARVSPPGGLEAMQAINIVVLNRSFLGLFMGTAVVSLLAAVIAASQWQVPSSPWLLALNATLLSRSLNYLGCFVGLAGIATVYPAEIFTEIFGLSQIAWFVWLGVVILRSDAWFIPGFAGAHGGRRTTGTGPEAPAG